MATSKLIKPTNVTVSIPAFTDQPDQRVNSNCIDKSIDGINALSDQIGNVCDRYAINGGATATFNANAGAVILITRASISQRSIYVVDQIGTLVEFMSGTKNETISISDWVVTLKNNSGAAFQATVIRPYN